MTENDKREVLQSLGVVLEHLKQQLSVDEAQAIQNKILNELTARPLDDFSMPRVPFQLEMPGTILARETQISQLTQVVEYVSHTAASDLTDEGIRAYYHALS